MELTLNIVLIVLYALSIVHLGFRFMALGACHSNPQGRVVAIRNFFVALVLFILTTIGMMIQFSLWFGVPIVLIFITPFLIFLYASIENAIYFWKEKRNPIDRTE